jgi:NAD(P)-dependent dehydrogenase (short-subunit alcohol dehydrogenase family)
VNEQTIKLISNCVPLGWLGVPNEIAKAVVFLAFNGRSSSYFPGAELFVDGDMVKV